MKIELPLPYNSKPIILWNFFIFITSIYSIIAIPLSSLFQVNASSFIYLSLILVSFIYIADIYIHFNIAYLSRMQIISDKKNIKTKYLKGWFIVDLFCCIPYELFFISNPELLSHPLVYLLTVLRFIKIYHASNNIIKTTKIKPTLYRLLFLILFILLFTHFIACTWSLLTTSLIKSEENFFQFMINHYLQSFYWTITTITTIGYGDITPDKSNNIQLIFVIFLQLIGAGIYGFIIGNIANLIAKFDIAKANHNENTDSINEFLKYHNIPQTLAIKVNDYYQYLWETRHGYDEKEIMNNLPISLQIAVSIQINKEMIEKVPFFKDTEASLIEAIILNLEPVIYPPNDLIVRAGDIGVEMFFIKKGSVSVVSPDGTTKYTDLHQGSFFGEIALIDKIQRTANIIANEYCDLYILKKDAFDAILNQFPKFKKQIKEFAAERHKEATVNEKK